LGGSQRGKRSDKKISVGGSAFAGVDIEALEAEE
jgi:hypothetical protein